MNKMTPAFWDDVKVGDVVQMMDEQALEDSRKRGNGLNPIDYTVGEVRTIGEVTGLGTWMMYRLDDPGQQTLWLVLKIVDELMDVRVYYTPDEDFTPNNRDTLVNEGKIWMLDTTQGLPIMDALFAPSIAYVEKHDDGSEISLNYIRKTSTLTAEMAIDPPPAGLPLRMMTLVTEYNTSQSCLNPELLVLEVGDDEQQGGLMQLFLGANLGEADFAVLKR